MSDVRPGYRRIPITVVFHLYEDVLTEWDESNERFYIEENHCIDNYVDDLAEDIAKAPGRCQTCHRASAYLGHLPFDQIRKVQEAMPNEGATPQTGADKVEQ